MSEQISIQAPTVYDHDAKQVQQMLSGIVDYVEAGDCRVPGTPQGLRAIATGDASLPVGLYGAGEAPSAKNIERVSETVAIERLKARREQLASSLGHSARVFTIKRRKAWTEMD